MPPGSTQLTVINEALQQIAAQTTITSISDPQQPAGLYAAVVYNPTVQLLLRKMEPAFARYTKALTLSAAVTPVEPWAYEYLYPTDCVRLLQVAPASGAYDVLDPQPIRSNVGFDLISAVNTKVVLTNQVNAVAIYVSSTPTEIQWDPLFQDTVVRRLANPLAMALSGRPDFAREILEESAKMAASADMADENMIGRS